MSAWWWVPIGLVAWLSVSLPVGLLLARFFRHAAQARDALDAQAEERPAERREPPQDGPRVALRAPKRAALRHLFPCRSRRREPVGLGPAAARAGDVARGAENSPVKSPALARGRSGRFPAQAVVVLADGLTVSGDAPVPDHLQGGALPRCVYSTAYFTGA